MENIEELQEALNAKTDIVMLDNFDQSMIEHAVEITQRKAKLEISGGISLDHLASFTQEGIDFISVGSITKHVQAIDFSMRVV